MSHFLWQPQLRDPADEMILELAVNGCADAIVTLNRRDFLPAASHFGLEVLSPGDFLRRHEIMSRYALRLPDYLLQEAKKLAQEEHTSLNQLVTVAIAEKIAALRTQRYFQERAAQADEKAFLAVLDKIRQNAGPVVGGDEL